MRAAAVIGWLGLLAGCNKIFGIDDTQPFPLDGPLPKHIQLDYQVLEAPGQTPQLQHITNLDKVKIGPIGDTLQDASIDDMSRFEFPFELEGHPCRIVFTLPGELSPREVVWTCLDDAHYTIPVFGRVDRTFAPGDSTISFATFPVNPPGFGQPRMFTTGLWSQGVLGPQGNPAFNIYSSTIMAPKTAPMGGALGVLDHTHDVVWLVDYTTQTSPDVTFVAGFARGTVDLVPGTSVVTPSPMWSTPPIPATSQFMVGASEDDTIPRTRISTQLGHVGATITRFFGGATASLSMPASTKLDESNQPDDGVFFPLVTVPSLNMGVPATRNPFVDADLLPLSVVYRVSNTRSALGAVSVTSGFQTVFDASVASRLDTSVGLAQEISIQDPAASSTADLNGPDGETLKFSGTMPLKLGFKIDMPADACLLTVFKIDGSALDDKLSIDMVGVQANQPLSVDLDPTAFETNQDYLIRITCRLGYLPTAIAQERLDAVTYPFRSSTNFAATFHTMP